MYVSHNTRALTFNWHIGRVQLSMANHCFLVLGIGLISLYLLLPSATATLGVDLSTSTSATSFSCLKQSGYDFVIVRAYLSYGKPDSSASSSIANARSAGINIIDIYMFPCPKCASSASEQVAEMGKYIYYIVWT